MKREELYRLLSATFPGFDDKDIPRGARMYRGKVRDVFDLKDSLLISVSDRISAFDRILSTLPCKGEVLNRISLFWFDRTKDIVPNHIIRRVSSRAALVHKCRVLPVEVVVRGYLTGSAWRDYKEGKQVSGIPLPKGMRMDERFPEPLITPSTKEEQGLHDRPVSRNDILDEGIVEKRLWAQVEEAAFALFRRGTELLEQQGLILVDTKYEFGVLDGKLMLVDEVHTPDSSRFWFSDTYAALFEAGASQRKLDKEYLRQWLMDRGFMGNGAAPEIPDEVRIETAWKYVQAYERITGEPFFPQDTDPEAEKRKILSIIV